MELTSTHYAILRTVNESPQREHKFPAKLYQPKAALMREGYMQYIGERLYQITEKGLQVLTEYCKAIFGDD